MGDFSLVHRAWIPVRLADGTVKSIAPYDISADYSSNPVIAFAWPRADFNLAAHELMIGLLAAIYPVAADKSQESREWIKFFHEPPTPDFLKAEMETLADAFVLDRDGEGPRFCQDLEKLHDKEWSAEQLLIDGPGKNTVECNSDLFVKRGKVPVLCRAAAAMAVYTLQQFAPSGGAGHRTSLRGGGPLVMLAVPDGPEGSLPTLWQELWLNTPSDLRLNIADKKRAFPWFAPTRTSAQKDTVHEANANRLQALFGMPWRVRLIFEENSNRRTCALTGTVDDIVCKGFIRVPKGIRYGEWGHPTTPYRLKSKSFVHTPKGRLGYRQWLGAVYRQGNEQRPAATIINARDRLNNLGNVWKRNSRLFAGGYAMDKRKAIAFAEAEMPLHDLDDPKLIGLIEQVASMMVGATEEASKILASAIKRALFSERSDVKFDKTLLENPKERLWEQTEAEFHIRIDEAIDRQSEDEIQHQVALFWHRLLKRTAFQIFEDTVPLESFIECKLEDIGAGREQLACCLGGKGKLGAALFKALSLDPPELKRRSKPPYKKPEAKDPSHD